MTVAKLLVKGAKKLVSGSGRRRIRGRGEGTNVEKAAAIDNGFVKRDAKGNIKTNKKGNPIPDVPAYRAAQKSAKKVEQTTVETPTRTPVAIEGGPTGYPVERLAALRTMPKGAERGEIGRLLRQSEQTRRAEQFPAPPERGRRTGQVDPTTGQIVEGGVNTRLRSLHRPDYKEVHDQAVAFLKEKVPGKSEAWYERKAIQLIEAEFRKGERGQEVISGTPGQIMGMMRGKEQAYTPGEISQVAGGGSGIEAQLRDLVSQFQAGRGRKHGGIVRRRKGGAIGVGAALRGYGKGYKKGGKI